MAFLSRARFRAERGCVSASFPLPEGVALSVVVPGCRVKFLRKNCAEPAGVRLVKNVKLTVESLPELCNFQRARAD